jgi:hypothetical protein
MCFRDGSNGSTAGQSCQSQISPQVALEAGPIRQVSNSRHGVYGNGDCRSEEMELTRWFDSWMSPDPADAQLLVRDIGSDDICVLNKEGAEKTRLAEVPQFLSPAWPPSPIVHAIALSFAGSQQRVMLIEIIISPSCCDIL